jgi:hypothetical protein
MFRAHLPAVLGLIFTPQRDRGDRLDAGTCYIGLGDEFDDDRRLIRAAYSGNILPSGRDAGRNTDIFSAPN